VAKLLTLKEIAKTLDVPESSLRKYREIFSDFIPSVGSGRSRRYKNGAIDVLRDIRSMREENHLPWDAISEQLAEKYPMEIASEPASGKPSQGDIFSSGQQEESRAHEPQSEYGQSETGAGQQQSLAPTGEQLMRKIAAMSEKQTMALNAVAIELMNSIEAVRQETRRESRHLHGNVIHAMESLSGSLAEMSRKDRKILSEVKGHVEELDRKIDALATNGAHRDKIEELQNNISQISLKLAQKEASLKEQVATIENLKLENARIREQQRRIAYKEKDDESRRRSSSSGSSSSRQQPSFLKRVFGIKS